MKSRITVLWLISICFAFAAGFYAHGPLFNGADDSYNTLHDKDLVDVETSLSNTPAQVEDSVDSPIAHKLMPADGAEPQDQNEVARNSVLALLSGENDIPFTARAEAYGLIAKMSEEDLLLNLEYLSAFSDDPKYIPTILLFMERYASISPFNALTFVVNSMPKDRSRQRFVDLALTHWARKEPDLAMEWYQTNSSEITRKSPRTVGKMLAMLAKQDKELAMGYLKYFASDYYELRYTVRAILSTFSQSDDYRKALESDAFLDSAKVREQAITEWSKVYPKEAIVWLDSLPEGKKKQGFEYSVFMNYLVASGDEAADWYLSKVKPNDNGRRFADIVNTYSAVDPESALRWVRQQTNIDIQSSIEKVLSYAGPRDHSFVLDRLDLLESKDAKVRLLAGIFFSLKGVSEERAQQFLDSSPHREDVLKYYDKNNNYYR